MINIVNRTFSLLGVVLISVLRLVSISRSFYFFSFFTFVLFKLLSSISFLMSAVFQSILYVCLALVRCAPYKWVGFQFSLPPRYSLQPVILRVSFLLGVGISVRCSFYSYSLHLLGYVSLVRNISRNSSSLLSFC